MTARRFWGLAAFAVIAYLYWTGEVVWSLALLFVTGYLFLDARIARLARHTLDSEVLPPTNTLLACDIGIDRVLATPVVTDMFQRLKAKSLVKAETAVEWGALLLANYQKQNGTDNTFERVSFHARGDCLFKNDKLNPFQEFVYHEITIPYEFAEEPPTRSVLTPHIHYELTIRLLLVNGLLQLQVGRFDEAWSPHVYRPGPGVACYQTFTTIASFPLMYFAGNVGFPVSLLGLSLEASETYKQGLDYKDRKMDKYSDWGVIQADLAVYRLLSDSAAGREVGITTAAVRKFAARREELVAKSGFKTSKEDTESWRWPNTGKRYWNEVMNIEFQNFNLRREFAQRHWLVDYTEEMP